jgi:MORN repeat
VITYTTGQRFEGMFAGGKRNGLGIETRADGSKAECQWANDARQTPCTEITKDGKRIEFRGSRSTRAAAAAKARGQN